MTTPVSSIRNLGPATEQAFRRVGIDSAEALHALGPDAAYARLISGGQKPHFIGYYALVLGLMGRPWTDCRGTEKQALRDRFDALVADIEPARTSGIERILDEIGVPSPKAHEGAS